MFKKFGIKNLELEK